MSVRNCVTVATKKSPRRMGVCRGAAVRRQGGHMLIGMLRYAIRRRQVRLALIGVVLAASLFQALTALGVGGNVAPNAIEIDQPSANLYPGNSALTNCSTADFTSGFDWVADCAANTDPPSITSSIATGIIPNVSGVAGGSGHWHGVRIVDGVATADQDIFLTGGKENDTTTWNVGPGSVGSAKYDITQAYLANNQTDLFFGMERRGNNGTTAFDFEFNQNSPTNYPTNSYIPTRTAGDVLLTFEMQGSGSSGSAVAHYFIWNATTTTYDEQLTATGLPNPPAGTVTSINNTATQGPPWGLVDSKGNWVNGTYSNFEFAEASVPLSILPGVNACGGAAYVNVRTRASAVSSSDLKDDTKIFPYSFGSPSAKAQLGTDCNQEFTYGSTGSTNASGSTSGLTYSWAITVSPTSALLSGGGIASTGTPGSYTSTSSGGTVAVTLPSGVDSAVITVRNTISQGTCSDTSGTKTVTVYRVLGATATLTPKCSNTFDFAGTASGGNAPYTYAWTFQKNTLADGTGTWSNFTGGTFSAGSATTSSGTFVPGVAGAYRALLTVTDTAGTASIPPDSDVTVKGICSKAVTSNTINVYDAVDGTISLTPSCDNTFGYAARGSGGLAPYTYAFTLEKLVSGAYTTATTFTASDSVGVPGVSGTLDINTATPPWLVNGEGTYRLKVTITDSQSIVCTKDLTSNSIDVREPLVAAASKTGSNGTNLSVSLTDSAGTTATTPGSDVNLQWQRYNGASWVDIAGANAATLTYSTFENDVVPTLTSFTLTSADAAGDYNAKLYTVSLHLHVSRTLNGLLCQADSGTVTVKKVVGVDP